MYGDVCSFVQNEKYRYFLVLLQSTLYFGTGNDLYEAMLDPWMQYTCGYWKDVKANNLGDAQIAKMDLIAKKLELKPGMKLLDIGM